MKNVLERSVLKSGTINITCHPVVIKDGRGDFRMVHIVSSASDTGVVFPRLPDEFEEVVDARENVVHEYDGVEVFVFRFAELVKRNESRVADFGEIFDTVVELASGALRCANHDAHADALC